MPIVAIEGPDKCGKSTLFQELKRLEWPKPPQFIETPSYGRERMHIASELSLRELEMWETFCRPEQLYVCNRHVLITEPVYSWYYGRKVLRGSLLQESTFVVYIRVPIEELQRRHHECNEDVQDASDYARVCDIYEKVVARFHHIIVTPSTTAQEVRAHILRAEHGR